MECPHGTVIRDRARLCQLITSAGGVPEQRRPTAPWPVLREGLEGRERGCTHLASFLSGGAFFARVPLSGERRPASVGALWTRAYPAAAPHSEREGRGAARLLPAHKQKRAALEVQTMATEPGSVTPNHVARVSPTAPDPRLPLLHRGHRARPGDGRSRPWRGPCLRVRAALNCGSAGTA